MAKGRPRKAGKRERNGRPQRDNYPTPAYDRGSERTQVMQARYGVHYASAIGRTYAAGLMGTGTEADDRYQAGKRFVRLHASLLKQRGYRCPLDNSPRGGNVVHIDGDRDQYDQEWLYHAIDKLAHAGLRPWLDELVSEEYIDRDPPWLTRLLMGGKDPYDSAMLGNCLRALDLISPPRKEMGILVA